MDWYNKFIDDMGREPYTIEEYVSYLEDKLSDILVNREPDIFNFSFI